MRDSIKVFLDDVASTIGQIVCYARAYISILWAENGDSLKENHVKVECTVMTKMCESVAWR